MNKIKFAWAMESDFTENKYPPQVQSWFNLGFKVYRHNKTWPQSYTWVIQINHNFELTVSQGIHPIHPPHPQTHHCLRYTKHLSIHIIVVWGGMQHKYFNVCLHPHHPPLHRELLRVVDGWNLVEMFSSVFSIFFLYFLLLVWPLRFQSLLIMGWCYSIPKHRLWLPLDSVPF